MKKLSYSKLKEKVKNANKKEFYALVIALWWIPLGSFWSCLLYTSPSPRDAHESRMPSSA